MNIEINAFSFHQQLNCTGWIFSIDILHEQILKSEPDFKDLNEMEIVSSMFDEQQTR